MLSQQSQQLTLFGVSEEQTSTCQIPVADYSIFNALETREVTPAEGLIYLKINELSNWETGQSHGISYSRLNKETGIPRTHVIGCVKSLVEKGWLEKDVRNRSGKPQNTSNTYRVVHHKCAPHEVPLDKDGLPKKCAVPRGTGSPFEMLKAGRICWEACLYWIVSKVYSDWTTGVVEMTVCRARALLRFSAKRIRSIRKSLQLVGLLERLSAGTQAFMAQLFPKPYKQRRKRRRENPKGMRFDGEFYFSFNERWRVSRKTGEIHTQIEGPGDKWRFATEFELETANRKIYNDFMPIVGYATSPDTRKYRESTA